MATTTRKLDMLSGRPRTPNDQYTVLTDLQLKNLKKDASPFFMKENTAGERGSRKGPVIFPAPIDRYATNRSQYVYRDNPPLSNPHCYIDDQWQREPPAQHNTCRLGATLRWGPPKTGRRTISHFHTEDVHRFLNIDVYKRNPTNIPAQVIMKHGRPSEGYYHQRNPHFNTWFGSSHQLNETNVLTTIAPKSEAEYAAVKRAEQEYSQAKASTWPEISEYTDKYLLRNKVMPKLDPIEERKKFHREQRRQEAEALLKSQTAPAETKQPEPIPA